MKTFTKSTTYFLIMCIIMYIVRIANIPLFWGCIFIGLCILPVLLFCDWNFTEYVEEFTLSSFRINDKLYEKSDDEIQEGDMVYDTKDNTYGICDMMKEDWIAIRDGHIVEVGVPKSRCFRLVLVSKEENY